ncbi:response regulator transcription factor [Candidatus Solincola sp.]|jgi:CheY-like chemotaxis protein|nr:response regulator [Actinomycetota bacterium]MDI7251612.1 response regulator [Actinomycetota bacterium]
MEARALVVDDDQLFLRLLELNLAKIGIKVYTAPSGREALRLAAAEKPDIILLDIMMPGMDGYEVLRQLKASGETRDIPIIMLTAKSGMEDRARCREMGAEAYITKPFKLEELRETVKRLIFPGGKPGCNGSSRR